MSKPFSCYQKTIASNTVSRYALTLWLAISDYSQELYDMAIKTFNFNTLFCTVWHGAGSDGQFD